MRILQSRACDISSVSEGVLLFLFEDPKEDFLKLKSPSGEESGGYTVTRTKRINANSEGQVSSTTNDKKSSDFLISFYIYQIRALLRIRINKINNILNYSE